MSLEDRFVGSMLGLAPGDAMGVKYEFGDYGYSLWVAMGCDKSGMLRWTDDTEMAIGLAESLVECKGVDPDRLAKRWAEKMQEVRGYGGGAVQLLDLIRQGAPWQKANRAVFPDGSFGNGAAMRAAPLGLYYHRDEDELREAVTSASRITHAHPLGIEGGLLVARAVALALAERFDARRFLDELYEFSDRDEFSLRLALARKWMDQKAPIERVREDLGTAVVAHKSVVTAIYSFCRFSDDFQGLMKFIIELGGDTDTIGAMAGGIFGAKNGAAALPQDLLVKLEARGEIERIARELAKPS